jgi:hypothetical protein
MLFWACKQCKRRYAAEDQDGFGRLITSMAYARGEERSSCCLWTFHIKDCVRHLSCGGELFFSSTMRRRAEQKTPLVLVSNRDGFYLRERLCEARFRERTKNRVESNADLLGLLRSHWWREARVAAEMVEVRRDF